jgi:hypothetical protein
MEMAQIIERLLAGQEQMRAGQEQMIAKMKDEMLAKMDANQAQLDALREEIRCGQAEIRSIVNAWGEGMMAYLGKTDATDLKANPEERQSAGEHQEVPREEAAVMPVGEQKKRRRNQNLAAEPKPKERTRSSYPEREDQQTQPSRAETKRLRGDQITRQKRPDSEEPRNEKTEDSGRRAEPL